MVSSTEDLSEHTVKSYEAELSRLAATISKMGGLAEEQLASAVESIVKRDSALGERVIASDKQIDKLESEIEQQAVKIIALRQPMALDLREIVSAMRIAVDLERIGDLAKNIGKRAQVVNLENPLPNHNAIDRMGKQVLAQLHRVLSAYVNRDADEALQVWLHDEEIDQLNNSLFRELLTYMMEDPRTIGQAIHMLFIAKNLERAGDHATNIAETIYYIVTGRSLQDERPKGDQTSETPIKEL